MQAEIIKIGHYKRDKNVAFLIRKISEIPEGYLSRKEILFITEKRKSIEQDFFTFNRLDHWVCVHFISSGEEINDTLEKCRKAGDYLAGFLNEQTVSAIQVLDSGNYPAEILAYVEGVSLGTYQFMKYKTDKKKQNSLSKIEIYSGKISQKEINELSVLVESVCRCRDLINEPNSALTATTFSKEAERMGKSAGIRVEVLNRKKIEALKMGGLLGVNKGSKEPPTFTIYEWAPPRALNKKPLVFVGKGVVFDSGGMNLKPGNSMTNMKSDMAGAAAVAAAIYAIARAGLQVHVIGLMPATDNRPGPEAVVSGDILKMHNGMTIEVIDMDAEGRLILADALSYARKFNPALVVDLATLTGSASRAIGKFGMVGMQYKAEKEMEKLKASGWNTYERIVEFPNWEEYGEGIKSDIADLKNLGPADAGAITAGKFLEKFTSYPYIHLDIAGPSFLEKKDSYRGTGGTGVGVRLLFNFVKTF